MVKETIIILVSANALLFGIILLLAIQTRRMFAGRKVEEVACDGKEEEISPSESGMGILCEPTPDGIYDQDEILMQGIRSLMESKKIYLDPEIRVGSLAEDLNTNKTYLSRAIKKKSVQSNFNQLIHSYRVKWVMEQFSSNPEQSIFNIAKEAGYKSMTTFNTAFVRNTGFTPADWCKDYRRRNRCEAEV